MNLIKSSSPLFLEKIIRMVAGFFISVIFARHLGPDQLGKFSFIIAFSSIVAPFALLGGEDYAFKMFGIKGREAVRQVFWQRVYISFVANVLALGFIAFTQSREIIIWTLVYFSFCAFRPLETFSDYLLYSGKTVQVSLCRLLAFLISSLLKIYGVFTGREWGFFVLVAGVEVVFTMALSLIYFKSEFKWRKISFFPKVDSILPAVSIILIGFSTVALTKIDQIMVEYILGPTALGNYYVVTKLFDLALFVPLTFLTIIYPFILQPDKVEVKISRVYGTLINMGLYLFVITFIFGKEIINLLYGNEYHRAGTFISFYSFLIFFVFISLGRMKVFIAEGKSDTYLKLILLTVMFNLVLNYFFITKFGLEGAVLATILAYLLSNAIYFCKNKDIRKDIVLVGKSSLLIFQPIQLIKSFWNVTHNRIK